MRWFELVLGDDFILVMIVAVIAGVASGFLEVRRLIGESAHSKSDMNPLLLRAGVVGVLLVMAYVDSKDIAITVGHVAVILGIYKLFQIFAALIAFWRINNAPIVSAQREDSSDV